MKKILRHPFRDQAALFLFSHAGPIKSNFEKIEPLDSSQRYKRYTPYELFYKPELRYHLNLKLWSRTQWG